MSPAAILCPRRPWARVVREALVRVDDHRDADQVRRRREQLGEAAGEALVRAARLRRGVRPLFRTGARSPGYNRAPE